MRYLAIYLFIIWGCSSHKTTETPQDLQQNLTKSWVGNPYSVCQESTYLCASSGGTSKNAADQSAKAELASIFRTKIKKTFQSSSTTLEENQKASQSEFMSEYINSQVDEILIGAEIQESFYDEKQDRHYSLARINKFVTQRDLKKKMDDIDDEMSSLLAKNHRLAYSKLLKLFEKRKAHNQIYIVVKNRFYPRKFERRTIEELRLSSRVPKKKIKIVESGKLKGSLKTIIDSLKSELVLVGHEIVNDGPDQVLWIKANKRKEFLNVKGFEKWSFSIHITNNEKDSSKGGIFIKKSKVGRDEKDAFLKIEKEIQTELKTEIEKLNL